MQQWARIAILGAMFVVAYLLILAWQKDYGHADSKAQQKAAVVSHEVSADLPNGQTAAASSDVPQANIAAQQTADATAPVSQQLISVKTDLYHTKTAMSRLSCWKAMPSALMLPSPA